MELTESDKERFWAKVDKTDSCWLWNGFCQKSGHGKFWVNGKNECSHRVSWLLAENTIPEGHVIRHAPHIVCGHANCVNPAHLKTGTIAENNKDMIVDGKTSRGTKSHTCKLSEAQVRTIREDTRVSHLIAVDYNVASRTIRDIKLRNSWFWLI